METRCPALCKLLFLATLALVITFTNACATAPPFIPPSGFSLIGRWDGTFTNPRGGTFPQTMIITEEKDGEIRGLYIAVRGETEFRGTVKLPEVRFETFGNPKILRLTSANTLEGWGEGNPNATPPIPPGQLYFKRKQ